MIREEWLDLRPNAFFKNKEFFPNLTDEDFDEILYQGVIEYSKEKHFIMYEVLRDNYLHLVTTAGHLRSLLGEPMIITSGFRSKRKHRDIYINQLKRSEDQIPWKSKHLSLEAFDFRTKSTHATMDKIKSYYNEDGSVKDKNAWTSPTWQGIYFEDFNYTRRENERNSWIHCQIVAPTSKNRFFKP